MQMSELVREQIPVSDPKNNSFRKVHIPTGNVDADKWQYTHWLFLLLVIYIKIMIAKVSKRSSAFGL